MTQQTNILVENEITSVSHPSIFTDLTLEATQDAMSTLVVKGKSPNGKLAYWFACCSIRTRLETNQLYAGVLRAYASKPLPTNRDELRALLPGIMTRQLNTLYAIEQLWNDGIIHFNCGSTFESQATWRKSMVAAIPGMGEKTISFALHIYNPFGCQLLTIDVWHIRKQYGRFDVSNVQSIRTAEYLRLEQCLLSDCSVLQDSEANGREYAPIVLAACIWERTRRFYGATKCGSGYSSHAGLSCYC